MLVEGIAGDEHALGFIPFAYYEDNQDKLKVVAVDDGDAANGAGPIAPSALTLADGTYQPLSRRIFIYVSKKSAQRAEVRQFVEFYLSHAGPLVTEVNYVSLGDRAYAQALEHFASERAH